MHILPGKTFTEEQKKQLQEIENELNRRLSEVPVKEYHGNRLDGGKNARYDKIWSWFQTELKK